jgi:hypothetical protein
MFTRAYPSFLSWARCIKFTYSYPLPLRSIPISPHLCLGLANGLFHSGLPTKIVCALRSHACYMPRSYHSRLAHPNNIWWRVQITNLLSTVIAQSVLRWPMGCTIGVLGFDSRRGLGIFLFTTASRTALGPTQPPIQWVPGALSLEVKRPGREADHSPLSRAEVKECVDLYLHTPATPPWRGT